MTLLLDTHTWLWYYLGDVRLSGAARALIEDPASVKLISPASFWELAIKVSLGKYVLNESYEDLIKHAIIDNGFELLPIEPRHAAALITRPHHHRDPFDRLLIAQAIVEGFTIVSVDPNIDRYPAKRVW